MATKPDEMIKWCEDNPAGRIQPPLASEQGGYPKNAVPPFQWMNWKFWNISRWIAWLEEQATSARIEDYTGAIQLNTQSAAAYDVQWARATTIAGMTRIDAKIVLKSGQTARSNVVIEASSYALMYTTTEQLMVQVTSTAPFGVLGGTLAVTGFRPDQGDNILIQTANGASLQEVRGFYLTFYGKRMAP